MTFEDYVNRFILQPLGMTNTGFKYTEEYVCTCVDITYAPSIKILDMQLFDSIDAFQYVNTSLCRLCSVILKMATGYINGGVAPLLNLGWNSPAGQMYSTVNDLFKVN